ncbi:FG-GAP repeat domain-containing protein [Siphonobacter aquaeclarae]|uniref:Repeat domain-containing protein n=1 Tax=Siphonobacter aquaeclarae TaxID=563176 RepID=A0A1G9M6H6_9BACT|nr:VCBS repeat-containing protein [Siphonobacter aquaeclarae]SDL69829.1 Repeat domain-containing protein [Siphonobacter aquaeclarae]
MKTGLWLVLAAAIAPLVKDRPFKQQKVSEERFEAVGVFDVNGDKVPDLVSGEWWYEGPSFKKKFFIGKVRAEGEYYDDFSTIPMDVNGDGRMDFVTGGWFGGTLIWKENTGKLGAEWPEHVIDACGNVETTRAWDVDGDGTPEIVPNNPGRPFKMYRLNKDGSFTKFQLLEKQGHGLGFGDVNGDGRGDFILADGWLEAPEKPFAQKWVFHEDFKLGQASVPILVTDVDKDGKNDLIVGAAHDYGLFWYKQSDANGQRTWEKKLIDDKNSQYHEMHWRDITGDGKPELVTGKRYRAHNDNDAGAKDDYGMFYFTWNGTGFDKHTIIFGPAGQSKGTGIAMEIVDLNGDKLPEIVAAGKDGLSVFWNGK